MNATANLVDRLAEMDRVELVRLSQELVTDEQAGEPQWQAYLNNRQLAEALVKLVGVEAIEAAL